MAISSIAILGGDLRQCHTAEYLSACGFKVTCFHTLDFPYSPDIIHENSLSDALTEADVVLAPTPLSKDGIHLFQADSEKPPCLLSELWNTLSFGQILAVYSLFLDIAHLLKEKGCQISQFSQPLFLPGKMHCLPQRGFYQKSSVSHLFPCLLQGFCCWDMAAAVLPLAPCCILCAAASMC